MSERSDLDQTFGRRSILLGVAGLGVFGALGARLSYLQITKAEDYRTLSDKNRFNFRTIVPDRGRILDRYGAALADNRPEFRVVIIPERAGDMDMTLDRLSQYVPLSTASRERILKEVKRKRAFTPILIDEHLGWETFATLNLNTPNLPGVVPLSGQTRRYPKSGVFSHIVGYVGTPDPDDVNKDDDPLLRQPTFQIGKTGVEEVVDKRLRGSSGQLKIEVNALGRIVREWPNEGGKAQSGSDVYLTLDAGLQTFSAEQFGEDSGGAALMDVETGELRVLLSMPTFDSNLFVSGLTQMQMDELNSNPKRPQFNKVLGGGFPPASTFKMAVALAGLEAGIIAPDETITCTGKTKLGNRDFHCWKRRGHGKVNLHDSLKYSCDTYYYEMAQRMGMEPINAMARRLGLGQNYDMGLGGQNSGILPDDEWKRRRLNEGWRTGDTFNASIGQGFVLATPLQLTVMTARMANGRMSVSPFLIVNDEVPVFERLQVNPEHLALVRDAMHAVCEVPGGTAYKPDGTGIKGLQMAGKTGTGQVRAISAAERKSRVLRNEEVKWKYRDHSLFVGFAPYTQPRFAAAAIVEHGGSGAKRAADIVRAILGKALKDDGLGEDDASAPQDKALEGQP